LAYNTPKHQLAEALLVIRISGAVELLTQGEVSTSRSRDLILIVSVSSRTKFQTSRSPALRSRLQANV